METGEIIILIAVGLFLVATIIVSVLLMRHWKWMFLVLCKLDHLLLRTGHLTKVPRVFLSALGNSYLECGGDCDSFSSPVYRLQQLWPFHRRRFNWPRPRSSVRSRNLAPWCSAATVARDAVGYVSSRHHCRWSTLLLARLHSNTWRESFIETKK